jgi:hypothetical protein
MHKFVYSETGRIDRCKLALYNLDCFQIANHNCVVPDSGFVRSPTGNSTEWGSLGFVRAWELRPAKPTLFSIVKSRTQSVDTFRRKARFEDLYSLDYNTELHSNLKELGHSESWWNWNLFVKDYLQARQSYRDSTTRGVGDLKPCAYYPGDKDIIDFLLVVAKFSSGSTKTNLNKRLRVPYK